MELVIPGQMSNIDQIEQMGSPRIFKTHLPVWSIEKQILETRCKVLYISRNPKDMLVSSYFCAELIRSKPCMPDWNVWFEMFCEDKLIYGNWFNHVLSWHHNDGENNFLFLKYEDLKLDISSSIKKMCEFLEVSYNEDFLESVIERTGFDFMKANPLTNLKDCPFFKEKSGHFLRKGEIGDWKNYFTVKQNERMDQLMEKHLQGTGLSYITTIPE